jgi:hypothetical protein
LYDRRQGLPSPAVLAVWRTRLSAIALTDRQGSLYDSLHAVPQDLIDRLQHPRWQRGIEYLGAYVSLFHELICSEVIATRL